MTRRHRDELRQAVDQARRAQLEAEGGYGVVEGNARRHDNWIRNAGSWMRAHQARELAAKGWTRHRIATHYGVHFTTVERWLSEDPEEYDRQKRRLRKTA